MTIVEVQQGNLCEQSLLGQTPGDLRLRVSWDSGHTGEVVHVGDQKATIGSDASRTVCLAGADIAPLECLVLRGAARSVVRWYDAEAAANGEEAFEDEVLRVGDQLQIGRAELEILGEATSAKPESYSVLGSDVIDYAARLDSLERQLAELQRSAEADSKATLTAEPQHDAEKRLAEQLEQLQQLHDSEEQRWAAERRGLEQMLAGQSSDLTHLRSEMAALQEDLRSLRAEQTELKPAAAEMAERLAEATQALREREHDDTERESAWQSQRQELEAQLEENQHQLAAFKDELAEASRQTSELQAVHEGAEDQIQDLKRSIQDLTRQLEEKEAEFAASREEWQTERERLQQHLEQANEQLAESQRERQQQADAHEATVEDLQAQLEKLQAQPSGEDEPDEAEATESLLDSTDDSPVVSDQAIDDSPNEDWAAAASPMDRFLSASSLIDDDDSFDAQTPRFPDSFSAPAETFTQPLNQDRETEEYSGGYGRGADHEETEPAATSLVGDYGSPAEADATPHETPRRQSTVDPPVSTAEVLARLGQTGIWNDDESEEGETSVVGVGAAGNFGSAGHQQPLGAANLHMDLKTSSSPAAEAPHLSKAGEAAQTDEEESIEEYMTRLLNRARGRDNADPVAPTKPPAEPVPTPELQEVRKAPQPAREEPVATIAMEEYKPARQAPEAASNLHAMRELANETRRTAIASHAKRNWSSVMKLKLLVSIFAALAVSASVIFFWGEPIAIACGSLAGLTVLGYWAHLARTYRKLLLESLMLDTSTPASAD